MSVLCVKRSQTAHLRQMILSFRTGRFNVEWHNRRRLGFSYWSLSQWAKHKVKNAVNYIGAFEQTLAAEAQRHRVDGVICGHIHHAIIHDNFGIRYMNCGDWVESCTALAEHEDGRFEIITWVETGASRPLAVTPDVAMDEETGVAA